MNILGEYRVNDSPVGSVAYDLQSSCATSFADNQVDCVIHAAEDGFSPFGQARSWLANSLDIEEQRLVDLANWVRFESTEPVFVAVRARNPSSLLRGVILSASESSESYTRFRKEGGSSEQFHRIMACATIHHAHSAFGARNIGITHLTESSSFREHVAQITAEAYLDLLDVFPPEQPSRLMFCGCCIQERHMEGAKRALAFAPFHHSRRMPPTRTEVACDGVCTGFPESGRIVSQFKQLKGSPASETVQAQIRLGEATTALQKAARTFMDAHPDEFTPSRDSKVEKVTRALEAAVLSIDSADQALHLFTRE